MVDVNSKDFFKINGVSSETVGIFVDTPSVPSMAKQRVTAYRIGTDEDLYTSDDSYEALKYKLIFYTFDRETFDNTDIYTFLADARTLEISRFPNYYFRVRQVSEVTTERQYDGKFVKYTATFTLAPFKYKTDNEWLTINSGDIVVNSGTRYCNPLLELTGAGETDFIFNGVVFRLLFPDNGQTVVADSERKIVYDRDTKALLYNYSAGKFPLLPVGATQVTWDKPSTVKILKNERCY